MAGQAGFEPATLGFGVRCSGQLELLTLALRLPCSRPPLTYLGFLVQRMAATTRTELFDLELLGLFLLVPGRHVVAPLAPIARQSNYFPDCRHDTSLSVAQDPARALFFVCKPTTGIEPVTSSLPRKCSTD